jgi:hypothetical protein
MRVSLLAAGVLLLRFARSGSIISDVDRLVTILYQPVISQSDTRSSVLASVEYKYNKSTYESRVVSYSPPAASDTSQEPDTSHPLYRILTDSPDSSTTITSLSTFNPAYTQTLTLHLNDDGIAFAASFSADPVTLPLNSEDGRPNLEVVLLAPQPGPTPKLNVPKPLVLDSDGKEIPQTPEVEKTFFQKYWWVFALVAMLALAGGGDK